MPEIINFGKVLNFAKVLDEKAMCWDWLGFSEGNGKERKRAERDFGEKRL